MGRLLLIAAIVAVGWYLYRRLVIRPGSANPPATPPVATGEDAVTRCAQCGVHVPDKSGVRYQTLFFCSPEHLNEHLRQQGKS